MIELVAEGCIQNTRNKKYIIDVVSELSQLETEFGNEAYCIANKKTYICDGTGVYVEKGLENGGGGTSVEALSVIANGTYVAEAGTAYSPVDVNVPFDLRTKIISENGTYTAQASGCDGFDVVEVAVPRTTVEAKTITENGTYTAEEGKAFSPVTVNVPIQSLTSKSVTANGTYDASSDGYDGYETITVDVGYFSFVVKDSGSFTTSGNIRVDDGTTQTDYSGSAQTVNFAYNDTKQHRIVITGNLTDISFQNCTGLVCVDVPFPKSMSGKTSFNSCFQECSSLTSIPSGLFDNCTRVTSFISCFGGCTLLTSIPSGLFDNCTAVTGFGSCFSRCTSLTAIPNGLFDNCTAVTSFDFCFYVCTSLTGSAPELWDSTIWSAVTSHYSCFGQCTNLSNYADIPSDWK